MKSKAPKEQPELFGPMYVAAVASPIGKVYVECDGERITRVSFDGLGRGKGGKQPKVLKEAIVQLQAYFAGRRTTFDLAVDRDGLGGTPFQRLVGRELEKIPYGITISYGDLARRIGNPNAVRAVGLANGRNPLSIVVPCHRVIGANGTLTGYGGGLERKRWLLDFERGDGFAALRHGG